VPPAEVRASGPGASSGTHDIIPAPHSANSANRVTKPLELEAPPPTPSSRSTVFHSAAMALNRLPRQLVPIAPQQPRMLLEAHGLVQHLIDGEDGELVAHGEL